MLFKQPGHDQGLNFVILNNQSYQDVGIKSATDAQGFMSSIDTCRPFDGMSIPFKFKTDLFFTRTKRRPSLRACHTRRVPGTPPIVCRMSAGTVVWPLAVIVDSDIFRALLYGNCKVEIQNVQMRPLVRPPCAPPYAPPLCALPHRRQPSSLG